MPEFLLRELGFRTAHEYVPAFSSIATVLGSRRSFFEFTALACRGRTNSGRAKRCCVKIARIDRRSELIAELADLFSFFASLILFEKHHPNDARRRSRG